MISRRFYALYLAILLALNLPTSAWCQVDEMVAALDAPDLRIELGSDFESVEIDAGLSAVGGSSVQFKDPKAEVSLATLLTLRTEEGGWRSLEFAIRDFDKVFPYLYIDSERLDASRRFNDYFYPEVDGWKRAGFKIAKEYGDISLSVGRDFFVDHPGESIWLDGVALVLDYKFDVCGEGVTATLSPQKSGYIEGEKVQVELSVEAGFRLPVDSQYSSSWIQSILPWNRVKKIETDRLVDLGGLEAWLPLETDVNSPDGALLRRYPGADIILGNDGKPGVLTLIDRVRAVPYQSVAHEGLRYTAEELPDGGFRFQFLIPAGADTFRYPLEVVQPLSPGEGITTHFEDELQLIYEATGQGELEIEYLDGPDSHPRRVRVTTKPAEGWEFGWWRSLGNNSLSVKPAESQFEMELHQTEKIAPVFVQRFELAEGAIELSYDPDIVRIRDLSEGLGEALFAVDAIDVPRAWIEGRIFPGAEREGLVHLKYNIRGLPGEDNPQDVRRSFEGKSFIPVSHNPSGFGYLTRWEIAAFEKPEQNTNPWLPALEAAGVLSIERDEGDPSLHRLAIDPAWRDSFVGWSDTSVQADPEITVPEGEASTLLPFFRHVFQGSMGPITTSGPAVWERQEDAFKSSPIPPHQAVSVWYDLADGIEALGVLIDDPRLSISYLRAGKELDTFNNELGRGKGIDLGGSLEGPLEMIIVNTHGDPLVARFEITGEIRKLVMSSDRSFDPSGVYEHGIVEVVPRASNDWYPVGTEVAFSATPNEGVAFLGWASDPGIDSDSGRFLVRSEGAFKVEPVFAFVDPFDGLEVEENPGWKRVGTKTYESHSVDLSQTAPVFRLTLEGPGVFRFGIPDGLELDHVKLNGEKYRSRPYSDLIARTSVLVDEGTHEVEILLRGAFSAERQSRLNLASWERGWLIDTVDTYNASFFVNGEEAPAIIPDGEEALLSLPEHFGEIPYRWTLDLAGKPKTFTFKPKSHSLAGRSQAASEAQVGSIRVEVDPDASFVYYDNHIPADSGILTFYGFGQAHWVTAHVPAGLGMIAKGSFDMPQGPEINGRLRGDAWLGAQTLIFAPSESPRQITLRLLALETGESSTLRIDKVNPVSLSASLVAGDTEYVLPNSDSGYDSGQSVVVELGREVPSDYKFQHPILYSQVTGRHRAVAGYGQRSASFDLWFESWLKSQLVKTLAPEADAAGVFATLSGDPFSEEASLRPNVDWDTFYLKIDTRAYQNVSLEVLIPTGYHCEITPACRTGSVVTAVGDGSWQQLSLPTSGDPYALLAFIYMGGGERAQVGIRDIRRTSAESPGFVSSGPGKVVVESDGSGEAASLVALPEEGAKLIYWKPGMPAIGSTALQAIDTCQLYQPFFARPVTVSRFGQAFTIFEDGRVSEELVFDGIESGLIEVLETTLEPNTVSKFQFELASFAVLEVLQDGVLIARLDRTTNQLIVSTEATQSRVSFREINPGTSRTTTLVGFESLDRSEGSSSGGAVTAGPGGRATFEAYYGGAVVGNDIRLIAEPEDGYFFSHWTGSGVEVGDGELAIMDARISADLWEAHAHFATQRTFTDQEYIKNILLLGKDPLSGRQTLSFDVTEAGYLDIGFIELSQVLETEVTVDGTGVDIVRGLQNLGVEIASPGSTVVVHFPPSAPFLREFYLWLSTTQDLGFGAELYPPEGTQIYPGRRSYRPDESIRVGIREDLVLAPGSYLRSLGSTQKRILPYTTFIESAALASSRLLVPVEDTGFYRSYRDGESVSLQRMRSDKSTGIEIKVPGTGYTEFDLIERTFDASGVFVFRANLKVDVLVNSRYVSSVPAMATQSIVVGEGDLVTWHYQGDGLTFESHLLDEIDGDLQFARWMIGSLEPRARTELVSIDEDADDDGDGRLNRQEYLIGSHPFVDEPYLAIEYAVFEGFFELCLVFKSSMHLDQLSILVLRQEETDRVHELSTLSYEIVETKKGSKYTLPINQFSEKSGLFRLVYKRGDY